VKQAAPNGPVRDFVGFVGDGDIQTVTKQQGHFGMADFVNVPTGEADPKRDERTTGKHVFQNAGTHTSIVTVANAAEQACGPPGLRWRHGPHAGPGARAGGRYAQPGDWDADGKRQETNSGTPDRDAAVQIAAKLETDAYLRKRGIIDATQERYSLEARRTIAEHVTDYLAALLAKGNTAKHAEMTGARVRFVIHDCGAAHAHDLQPSVVQATIKAIRDAGRSLETCNSYVRDVQPIRSDLAEWLRAWLDGCPRDERIFQRMPRNMARSFAKDLRSARAVWIAEATTGTERQRREPSDFLRYRDADGRVADFHATRHTYISGIVAGRPSVKTAQELARHSTPVLTIGRYSHARLHDLTGALDALPDLQPSGLDLQAQRATGTDGSPEVSGTTIGTSNAAKRGMHEAKRGNSHECYRLSEPGSGADSRPVVLSAVGKRKATSGETWRKAEGTGLEPATPYGAPHLQ